MNSATRMLAGIAVGAGLLVVAPSGARAEEESPGRCGAAGQFIASTVHETGGREFGEFSSLLAALQTRDEFARGLHALCEPQA